MTRALLIAHAVFAFCALFASTHHAVHALLAARGRQQIAALRRFGWIAPLCLAAQTATGLLLYPAYRVDVRGAFLDRVAPHVSQWFDFKEHLGALAIPLVLASAVMGRPRERDDNGPRWPLAAISSTGAAFLWAATLIGLYVAAVKAP